MVTESAAAKKRVLYGQINAGVLLVFGGLCIYSMYLIYSNWGASSTPTEVELSDLVRGEMPSNRYVELFGYQTLPGVKLRGLTYFPLAPYDEADAANPANRPLLVGVFSGDTSGARFDAMVQNGRGMVVGNVGDNCPPNVRAALKKKLGQSSINDMLVIRMGRRPSWIFSIFLVLLSFGAFIAAGVYALKNADND